MSRLKSLFCTRTENLGHFSNEILLSFIKMRILVLKKIIRCESFEEKVHDLAEIKGE